jgi:hypothetical protein
MLWWRAARKMSSGCYRAAAEPRRMYRARIELDPSIDASTASVIATPNLRSGSSADWNNTALQASPLGYCGGTGTNVVEVDTSPTNSPGAALKSAFDFMVP